MLVCRAPRSTCKHVRTARAEMHARQWDFLEYILTLGFYVCPPSVPCPPANITAVRTCAPDPVPVSWASSSNAKQYTAVAVSSRGHRSECTTNETSCSLPGLHCGEVYMISVSGADDNCTGQQSSSLSLNTGNAALIM